MVVMTLLWMECWVVITRSPLVIPSRVMYTGPLRNILPETLPRTSWCHGNGKWTKICPYAPMLVFTVPLITAASILSKMRGFTVKPTRPLQPIPEKSMLVWVFVTSGRGRIMQWRPQPFTNKAMTGVQALHGSRSQLPQVPPKGTVSPRPIMEKYPTTLLFMVPYWMWSRESKRFSPTPAPFKNGALSTPSPSNLSIGFRGPLINGDSLLRHLKKRNYFHIVKIKC